jgi:AhpD family alkylhydroperoxidase
MPRVPVHDLESAPSESTDQLKQLEERYGKVLNIHGEMAHAPALIDLFISAEEAIAANTSLDRRTRDAIHLAVAEVNDCDYCRSAYTVAAKSAGFDEEQTVAIRNGTVDFDDQLAAILDVAREIAQNKGYVRDETWQRAGEAGWSDTQVLETFADVIRTIMTNYFNHLVGTEIDLPRAPGVE